MADSGAALLTGGLFSLAVAGVSGLVAYYTARANSRAALATSRTTLQGEIRKISEQIQAQEAARERETLATLRQRFLTPLRYAATVLGRRLVELEAKYGSAEDGRMRDWFKTVKDEATRDRRHGDFLTWAYYEGLFAATTLYYTCSYFHAAQELRSGRPFAASRPVFGEALEARLATVTEAFVWDGGSAGIWDPTQEVVGELFQRDGAKLTYAQMCTELTVDDPGRRAPYLRPLDFYWRDLHPAAAARVRAALDELVAFLDSHDPRDG
jgi:hypothetical protein